MEFKEKFIDETVKAQQEIDSTAQQPEQSVNIDNDQNCCMQLAQSHQLIQDWQHKYVALSADFENYKRRTLKEFDTIRTQANVKILSSLLDIFDNFERAFDSKLGAENANIFEGFSMIYKSLEKLLSSQGVVPMNNYNTFDPLYHEALLQVPANDQYQAGQIVEVLQKGYLYNDKILRVAKVSVAI